GLVTRGPVRFFVEASGQLLPDPRRGLSELAQALADRAAHLGQALWAEHDQCDHQDDDQLFRADVEQGRPPGGDEPRGLPYRPDSSAAACGSTDPGAGRVTASSFGRCPPSPAGPAPERLAG